MWFNKLAQRLFAGGIITSGLGIIGAVFTNYIKFSVGMFFTGIAVLLIATGIEALED